ncbi:MAG: chorismate synthase [Thermoplasmata archaeon]
MNTLGKLFRVTSFGESHGKAIGCVIDGCPSGLGISEKELERELKWTDSPLLTPRREPNKPKILSGVLDGKTLGTPICIVIENRNADSTSYEKIKNKPRPGHAEIAYQIKYGIHDIRGGGRASGRIFTGLIPAGTIARKILSTKGTNITSKIVSLAGYPYEPSLENMLAEINARTCETFGGIFEIYIEDIPQGLGEPIFGKFHSEIGAALLSIPGIKSVEIGAGLEAGKMNFSKYAEKITKKKDKIRLEGNNSGGLLGGITVAERITFRCAVKPPTAKLPQKTLDLNTGEETIIVPEGRYDICFAPRAAKIAESLAGIVTVDMAMQAGILNRVRIG